MHQHGRVALQRLVQRRGMGAVQVRRRGDRNVDVLQPTVGRAGGFVPIELAVRAQVDHTPHTLARQRLQVCMIGLAHAVQTSFDASGGASGHIDSCLGGLP